MTYTLVAKDFEGPLELLLEIVEAKKLSINEVSLGRVTEEYFRYLEHFKKENNQEYHKEIAAFLVIAATLMLVKSRSLLPGFQLSEEEEEDIHELETRLQRYKLIKETAAILKVYTENRKSLFSRQAFALDAPSFVPPKKALSPKELLTILKGIIDAIPKKQELPQKIVRKVVSIEEKIKELERRIQDGVIKSFDEFVGEKKEKLNVIVSFLAMLELAKLGIVVARQSLPFDSIRIEYGSRKSA